MYQRFAAVYDAIYGFKNYAEESRKLIEIADRISPKAKTLLDVACGTGAHIHFLKERFTCAGVDLSGDLLDVARERLPDVEFHEDDMRTFDLGRTFDVVTCLFGAIGYMTTKDDLREAVGNIAKHVAPGGLLMVEPWIDPIEFIERRYDVMTAETETMKIARANTNWREENVSVVDFHFLVADSKGVDHFRETHRLGLFTHDEYSDAFSTAGFKASRDADNKIGRGLYVAQRANN